MKQESSTEEKGKDMDSQHKIKWTLYISLASMFIFVSVTEVGPFSSMKRLYSSYETDTHHKYVIVFDGGSTGTRIHVFTFVNNSSSGRLALENEYFEEVKPGLSNYANKPQNAANSVLHLLDKAKAVVPPSVWIETPVALRATAGLRLLPSALSESILDAISKAFQSSPFLTDEESVAVLDGKDEGLYAWYTLNFLLGKLNEASHSALALDLGGGSTQVTFTPVELDTFIHSPKEYIVLKRIQNKTMPIYTHSYLGLGLMSARLAILHLSSDNPGSLRKDETKFKSSCIHPHVKHSWKHDMKEYIIKGRKDEKYGFKECYDKAVQFLGNSVDKPEEFRRREIYALSYYFDRSRDLGIIDEETGHITVGDFMKACKNECSGKKVKEPFLCLDCSYISALLHHSLGLHERKEIQLAKRIDGIETSWGLGAAFNLLR
ncbi:ectonucleoside triphosphate diphosphohydrolase 5 [Trichonephila clavata]|uniref:Ectonucleoside triphosphate diphosphohydrolase 5 n=1 Tax=Trichonephila clavata TaxID=2740835 RepID=A0A8X6LV90_TRICU|nr:ectonucleoside triphosphate diphosphohydrolase 5 [Trichonephila clavata]